MTNKQKYREFCQTEKDISIFSKDWWLDSVCGEDNWDVLLYEKGGQIVASFPHYIKNNQIVMPKLTQTMGIYFKYPKNQKYYKKLSFEKEVINYFIDNLPKVDGFSQNFSYNFTNWLPFYWRGFNQTTRYTYIIEDLSNLDIVFSNFESNYKNKIRKAEKLLRVQNGLDIESFFKINKMTFDRQGIQIPYNLLFLKQHDIYLKNHREIFYAIDKEDNIHSALYLTWDKNSSYVHMVGENPNLRKSSAGILLVWEAIKYTKEILNLNKFDFEGSNIENIEQVRRSFGTVQKPYFTISKNNSKLLRLKIAFKDVVKAIIKN